MDGIFDPFGAWLMILLGGVILAGVAVLVPIAVIFSLRVIESAITGFRQALQGLGGLVTRAGTRRPTPRALPEAERGRQLTMERRTDT